MEYILSFSYGKDCGAYDCFFPPYISQLNTDSDGSVFVFRLKGVQIL